MTARVAFVSLLLRHDLTQALFQSWDVGDRWPERVAHTGAALDRFARELGVSRRFDIPDDLPNSAYETESGDGAYRAMLDFREALCEASPRYADDIERLLLGFGVAWQWLIWEMLEHFCLTVSNQIWAISTRTFAHTAPPPSFPTYGFVPRKGESPTEQLARFDMERAAHDRDVERFRQAIAKGAVVAQGRRLKRGRKTIERYVDWFYRHIVCGETLYSIAKRELDGFPEDRHGDVKRGISAARGLLTEASFRSQC
jgi:hypothetical protein